MKKKIIAVLALMLTLSACGKQESETTVPPTTEAVIETTEATTAPTVAETLPEETEAPTEAPTEPEGEPGVVNANYLNVREEPNVNAKKVAQLKRGTQVTVYEQTVVSGMTWGRIDEGWVSMDYIKLGGTASQDQQKPTEPKPTEPKPTEPKPTEPKPTEPKPTEPKPTEPKPTEPKPTEPKPTEPKPTEPKPTEPKPCQHQWVPIKNIPAEYEIHTYRMCSCGQKFDTHEGWMTHSASFSGDEAMNHLSCSTGTDQIEISPAMTTWQCSQCGTTKTINAWDNP